MKSNTKHIALISLGVMAGGTLAAIPFSHLPWVRFLQSGFEAGLVGGLADWFAVTALFRHPLGIPIPHTALLPKNRQRIAKALVETVQNDLLSKDSIRAKLDQFSISAKLLDGLEQHLDSEETKQTLTALTRHAVREVPLAPLVPVLEQTIRGWAGSLDTRQLLSRVLEYGFSQKWDEKAFDYALDLVERLVIQKQTADKLGEMAAQALQHFQTNGFMQFALNAFVGFVSEEKLGSTIQQFLLLRIAELGLPDNSTRVALLQTLRSKLSELPGKDETIAALDQWKQGMLEQMDLASVLEKTLEQLRSRLLAYMESEAFADEVLIPLLRQGLRKIRDDRELVERMETFIHDKLAEWVENNHHRIGQLIEENINRYDNESLIALMEDKLGRDLQWIRVNGAVCGFIIGLVLHGVRLLAEFF